ncbi:YebC/PmpR family DNA-binding transcriptional regulator [Patescibacteria group bacterium]
MSGHSKWSQIKHKKAAADAKKGQAFSKISRLITLAVREKGSDPETNSQLRDAIEKAKRENMPSDSVDRAIKKGSGEGTEKLEEFLYEAYGPGGVAILIEGITDSKNRTTSEIKHILLEKNAKWAETGSVSWAFDRIDNEWIAKEYSRVSISEEDKKSLETILGALDEHDDVQEIYTNAVMQ